MQTIFKFLLLKILFFSAVMASASSLDEVSEKILKGARSYKADSLWLVTQKEDLRISGNLPDPEIGVEYLDAPAGESNRWSAELSWGLDWPGVYKARRSESDGKTEAAAVEMEARRLERLAEIKKLLLDYILRTNVLKVYDRVAAANDSIFNLAGKANNNGELTVLDLNKIKIENANLKAARANTLNEMSTILASLSEIYGEDCSRLLTELDIKFPGTIIPDREALRKGLENSPYVRQAFRDADVAKASMKVVRMEGLPSISVGYKHAYEDFMHFNGATVGISIPVFSARGKKAAAKAAIAEAEFKAETVQESASAVVDNLVERMTLLHRQIEEIEPVVRDSDNLEMLLKAYRGGLMTVIEYLAEVNYFTLAEIELLNLCHLLSTDSVDLSLYISN